MNFNDEYNFYLDKVNKRLQELYPVAQYDEPVICDAMKYSTEIGGKRIRPVLVLECCRICGGDIDKAVDIACAIEFLHTYSLIHDDLPCMDDDDLRRGQPSCHIQFGEEYALLAGDGLLTYSFEVISNSSLNDDKKIRIIKSLASNAGYNGMIGGQVIDLKSEGKSISFEKLKKLHSLKTGCLIKCAAEIGSICGNADKKLTESLITYAENLGLAFQIVDDILDVEGDEGVLGKPIGSDVECQKTTYVTLFGLEESKTMAEKATSEAISAIKELNNNEFLNELALKLSTRKI